MPSHRVPITPAMRQKILRRTRSLCPRRPICRSAFRPTLSSAGLSVDALSTLLPLLRFSNVGIVIHPHPKLVKHFKEKKRDLANIANFTPKRQNKFVRCCQSFFCSCGAYCKRYLRICTALLAAPLRIWSPQHQRVRALSCVRSSRTRPTHTRSCPLVSSGVG